MKFVEFLKGIGNSLSKILGDDPRFRVEESSEVDLVAEMANSGMSKAEISEVVMELRNSTKRGTNYSQREDNSIRLDSKATPETELNTSFRDDETMKMVRNTGIKSVSAKELPNSERASGGKERDSRGK